MVFGRTITERVIMSLKNKVIAGLAGMAVTIGCVGTVAEAATYNADNVGWGQLDVIDLRPIKPGLGKYTIRFRDTERDGMCVRAALVNEDGSIYKMGPKSCGKRVTWRPTTIAEDWPAPILIRSDGERSTPS